MNEEIISKLVEEQLALREKCRERYFSAVKSEENPIDHRYDKNKECLKCKGNLDSEVECIIKNHLKLNKKQLEDLLELPHEKLDK